LNKNMTFEAIRFQSQVESAIERMDEEAALSYCKDAVIDIVMNYSTAGERTVETVVFMGRPVLMSKDVRSIIYVKDRAGRILSSNSEFEIFPDNRIIFRENGAYEVSYTAFPNLSDLEYTDEIPLPPRFQDAVHWYLSFKYYARMLGPTDVQSQYFSESYNNACVEADSFYAGRQQYRRIPARRR